MTPQRVMCLVLAPLGIAFFVLAAETIGFVLAAGIMLFGMLAALRVRLVNAVLLTTVFVPALYHVFAVYLGVPLPWGWWGW